MASGWTPTPQWAPPALFVAPPASQQTGFLGYVVSSRSPVQRCVHVDVVTIGPQIRVRSILSSRPPPFQTSLPLLSIEPDSYLVHPCRFSEMACFQDPRSVH